MENCIEDLRNWLIEGRLLLNDDKTEFLVIGTRQQLNKLNPSVLHVGDDTIDPSVTVRNLGTILDNSISMDAHINQVCKAAFYHIHNIRRVSKYLSQECLKTLIHAFVTSRLDYCNLIILTYAAREKVLPMASLNIRSVNYNEYRTLLLD